MVLLRVAYVEVKGPRGCVQTLALCDEGSTITLMQKDLADKIGAYGPKSPLNLVGASGMAIDSGTTMKIDCHIRPVNGPTFYPLTGVRTVEDLNLPLQTFQAKEIINKWPHLSRVPLSDLNGKPQILIEIDHWPMIILRTIVAGPPNGPIATSCRLGWTLGGGTTEFSTTGQRVNHLRPGQGKKLDELIKTYFDNEELGPFVRKHKEKTNERAETLLRNTTIIEQGRWQTGLLW